MQMSSHTTNEYSGDCTTTSTVIANKIQEEGLRYIQAGHNPIIIKRGLEKARRVVEDYLEDTKVLFDYKDEVNP